MRVHFYEDDTPLDPKCKAVTAICGKVIRPMAIVYQRDGQVFDKYMVYTSLFCRNCFDGPLKNKRYLYGIVNAQDLDSLRGKEE